MLLDEGGFLGKALVFHHPVLEKVGQRKELAQPYILIVKRKSAFGWDQIPYPSLFDIQRVNAVQIELDEDTTHY